MLATADYVHSKGDEGDKLVFGLYTCGGKETCVGGRVGSENYWTQDARELFTSILLSFACRSWIILTDCL